MALRKRWLECTCGFAGLVFYRQRPPDHCPACQQKAYRQLKLGLNGSASPKRQSDPPAGWEQLTPAQKAQVERYIATLLAEQPRLF